MKKKYVCPLCGGQLMFWEEYVYDKQQLVNKQTGLLNKKVQTTAGSSLGTNGLKCTQCGFMYSGSKPEANAIDYDFLNDIFEKIK